MRFSHSWVMRTGFPVSSILPESTLSVKRQPVSRALLLEHSKYVRVSIRGTCNSGRLKSHTSSTKLQAITGMPF